MQIIEDSLDNLLKQVAIRTNKVANRAEVEKAVDDIIANVIENGDQALKDYEKNLTVLTSKTCALVSKKLMMPMPRLIKR